MNTRQWSKIFLGETVFYDESMSIINIYVNNNYYDVLKLIINKL